MYGSPSRLRPFAVYVSCSTPCSMIRVRSPFWSKKDNRSPVDSNVTLTGNEHKLVTTEVDALASASRYGWVAWAGLAPTIRANIAVVPHAAIRGFMIVLSVVRSVSRVHE